MKLTRDNWLVIGLVVLLSLLTLAAALQKNNLPTHSILKHLVRSGWHAGA